ncbi:MCE family protein [Mycobacterium sp. URHB0044]|uniref:MCE family protein n=1 Tax=Mycobacterium sp. URHB0044 TaxID=1380386 RepID=UPI00048CC9FE|nr:MlaD family protein [Mycobacterium sp. URHB0044]
MRRVHLRKRTVIQLAVFAVVTVTASSVLCLTYLRLPSLVFSAGQYDVTVELPVGGGLYARGNVTYLGVQVGQVKDVRLTREGVEARLSLQSDVKIPSDLDAQVHSQTAVGEQYVELVPREANSTPLKNGDVIPLDRTSVAPDINELLDATNRGLKAIPGDNLKTVIDESYTAFNGLGPELSRLVRGSSTLAIDARNNLTDLTNLADNSAPLLDTQTDTSDSVRAWASHLATITGQLRDHDDDVRGILRDGPAAVAETQQLLDRFQPTLPVVLANLVSLAPVLVTYQASLEQLLVLLPIGVQIVQGALLADKGSNSPYAGLNLNFNLNLNLPPPCTTGFLPVQQMRAPSEVDYPERPAGDLYCRIPQDAMFDVRGARNLPCVTRPGKRAPTVKLCESDENYVPLNDGFNWKGDPNATLSGQSIPQLPPDAAGQPATRSAAPPPVAVAQYDPATGRYVGPDGKVYVQGDLNQGASHDKTWQNMLLPPPG